MRVFGDGERVSENDRGCGRIERTKGLCGLKILDLNFNHNNGLRKVTLLAKKRCP